MQREVVLPADGEEPAAFLSPSPAGVWFVAHTRSRNEKILAHELTRLGVTNYLPLARRVTRSRASNRISRSEVPVFPGYLFFNANEDQRYLALRTNRVANLLDVPNQQQLIVELRSLYRLLSRTQDFSVVDRLQVGDWGRIIAGPLAGIEGLVTCVSHRTRLSMNVTILGQSVTTEIDAEIVERIDRPGCL